MQRGKIGERLYHFLSFSPISSVFVFFVFFFFGTTGFLPFEVLGIVADHQSALRARQPQGGEAKGADF